MRRIGDCIPDLAALCRQAAVQRNAEPSPEKLEEMRSYLLECGYRRDNPDVFDAILRYGALELEGRNSRGLFLKGPCGIGKSLGLALLAAKFGWPVINAAEYETEFLSRGRDSFDEFADALNFFGEPAKVVVIDDLGVESNVVNNFGTVTNVMSYVLDRRYRESFSRQNCRTLIASNLTDAEIHDRYGQRIDSRLDEMMDFYTVTGRSLRR